MPNVLIGAAGTGTAFAACTAIRRHWGHRVRLVAMDINPSHLVTSSLLADAFYQVPLYRDNAFVPGLHSILDEEKIDFYLPLFPLEITMAAKLRESGSIRKEVQLIAPPISACNITSDKYQTACWLRDNDLPSPRTSLGRPDFHAQGYCVKPRTGTGSIGVRLLSDEQLEIELTEGDFPSDELDGVVIQEQCRKPEITIDAYLGRDRSPSRVLCRERIEVKSGVATKVRIFEDSELTQLAMDLGRKLDITGVFCFQVMRGPDGWCVLDINARPGAATSTCTVTGNDFFAAMFANSFGEDTERFFRPLSNSVFVTRQYSDFLMIGEIA